MYEASARMRDPVYGCVGAISYLQKQISQLQMQLAIAQAEILYLKMQQAGSLGCQRLSDEDDRIASVAAISRPVDLTSTGVVVQKPIQKRDCVRA